MLFSEFVLFTIFVSFIDKWSPQIQFLDMPLSVDYSCVVWLKSHHKRHCGDVRSGVLSRQLEDRLHEDGDFSRLASGLTVHLAKARAAGNSNRWLWIALNFSLPVYLPVELMMQSLLGPHDPVCLMFSSWCMLQAVTAVQSIWFSSLHTSYLHRGLSFFRYSAFMKQPSSSFSTRP